MANISQHEAAELWELARDHFTTGAKLQFLCQHVQDTQLRGDDGAARPAHPASWSTDRRLYRPKRDGDAKDGRTGRSREFPVPAIRAVSVRPVLRPNQREHPRTVSSDRGQGIDILAAGECLKDCKRMAVAAVMGATEASQPARNVLYQIGGRASADGGSAL